MDRKKDHKMAVIIDAIGIIIIIISLIYGISKGNVVIGEVIILVIWGLRTIKDITTLKKAG